MRVNAYEAERLALARRIVAFLDRLPARTIGGTVLVFGLLATLAFHANKPVAPRPAPACVAQPIVLL